MSEYIINLDGELGMALAVACASAGFAREKIVRCRDCRNRAGENEQGVDQYFCALHRMHTQPEFFCAWGEPREEL